MQRLSRLVTPLLVVALAALVAWWTMRLLPGASIAIPPQAVAPVEAGSGRVEAVVASARLFGSRRPGVLSDNVRALGVVADQSGRGSVIVSVDGQAARVYRVGDTLDGRLVAAIRPDAVELESGGARQVLRLPPPRATATGLTIIGAAAPATAPAAAPGAPLWDVKPYAAPAAPATAAMSTPPPMPGGVPGLPMTTPPTTPAPVAVDGSEPPQDAPMRRRRAQGGGLLPPPSTTQ